MMHYQQQPANPENMSRPYLPGCSPLNLSSRGRRTREYLDTHKNVEKRRRDRINNCLETIRQCVPPCRQIPSARRLEKGEILDMTISYLQLVNHFLAGIGIQDVYTASKQQVNLYQGIHNWIREHHSRYDSIPEFTKDLNNLLKNEIDIISSQVTIEQTWSSRKAAASSAESLFAEDIVEVKTEPITSAGIATDIQIDNGVSYVRPGSPSNTVTIKQEYPDPQQAAVKKFKFSNLVEGIVEGAMSDKVPDVGQDNLQVEIVSPKSSDCLSMVKTPAITTPHSTVMPRTQTSCQCDTKDSPQRTNNNDIPLSESNSNSSNSSVGEIEIQTSAGNITIPIRLGSIQIKAPPEMLQPLRQACIKPVIFNAQLQSSNPPTETTIPNKCSCKPCIEDPLTVHVMETNSDTWHAEEDKPYAEGNNKKVKR